MFRQTVCELVEPDKCLNAQQWQTTSTKSRAHHRVSYPSTTTMWSTCSKVCNTDMTGEYTFAEYTTHVMVMSEAGKPIYTMNGRTDDISSLCALIATLVSTCADQSDSLRTFKHRWAHRSCIIRHSSMSSDNGDVSSHIDHRSYTWRHNGHANDARHQVSVT